MNGQKLADYITQQLKAENVIVARDRRVFAEIPVSQLVTAVRTLKESGMINIGAITGLDLGDRLEVMYYLYNNEGVLLSLKVYISREDPHVPTVTDIFPGVFMYERELIDLFGIMVDGIPYNRKYPIPEDWPEGEYPLRKDWKGLPKEKEVTVDGSN